MNILHLIAKVLIAPVVFVAGLAGYSFAPSTPSLGAVLPSGVAVFETSLQTGITSSATSMTLSANSVRGGSTLSGYNCFTVDEGSAQAEYICGTVSGTSVTSLLRGVDPVTATTTNATLQFAHRRGADVKITDFPLIQIMRNQLNGVDTIPSAVSYASHPTFTSGNQLVDKTYADQLSFAGVATSTETSFGGVWLSTQAGMSASTYSSNAPAVLYSRYSTSSPTVTSGSYIPVTRSSDNKISPQFIATTSSDTYRFGGKVELNGQASTTVLSANYAQIGGTATTTITDAGVLKLATTTIGMLQVSPTGVVYSVGSNGAKQSYSYASTSASVVTASTFTSTNGVTIPAGVLTASSTIYVKAQLTCVSGGSNGNDCSVALVDSDGNQYLSYTATQHQTSSTGYITFDGILMSNNSLSSQRGSANGMERGGTGPSIIGWSSAGSGSIDWTTSKKFVIKTTSNTSTGNTTTLGAWSIVVNP